MKISRLLAFVLVLLTIELTSCEALFCFKGVRPALGVRCEPGEQKVRVVHDYCQGTGYVLEYRSRCGTCNGQGAICFEGDIISCFVCCGDGRRVDKLCRGKGWTWQCKYTQP